jgi:TolB-like protein/DNA-binding winged helix-turn-helix (wHTH) protein/Flp pilus assembly protein TadD
MKLQDQPFAVLLILLEKPGQLVTKEELQRRLWPADTFVEFDKGIYNAMKRLRETLGDEAEAPRYIETLPRRGYRFIAPVQRRNGAGEGLEPPPAPTPRRAVNHSTQIRIAAGFVGVLVVAAGGWSLWRTASRATTAASLRSIAVLPLENLSADPAQDYFADGMTDELIASLGQIGSVRVISRTSIMQYKGVHKPLPQIARELNVDAVVEGAVLRSGNQIRITAQLIQARDDQHLWAETYQGDLRDALGLQNQIASAIVREIRVKLTAQQQASLRSTRALHPEAYEAYLRALAQSGSIDGLQKRISYFGQALAAEPDYPEAHTGLGYAYLTLGHMVALPPQEAFPRAKSEALAAIRLDDSLAESHALLANVTFLYDWDFAAAEKEFKRAIALNPNSTSAHAGYAPFLNAMGRPDEAIAERVINSQIDPLSLSAIAAIGWEQYWAGRYDLAIENARKVLTVNPNEYNAHLCLGVSLEQKGKFPEAIVELQRAVDLSNDQMWMAFVAHAKALAGDKAGARKILADFEALSHRAYVSPYLFALVYPDLGDKERAFFWLEKCYVGREHDLVFSKVWPMFNSLRSDPRYQELMKRIGLPE